MEQRLHILLHKRSLHAQNQGPPQQPEKIERISWHFLDCIFHNYQENYSDDIQDFRSYAAFTGTLLAFRYCAC